MQHALADQVQDDALQQQQRQQSVEQPPEGGNQQQEQQTEGQQQQEGTPQPPPPPVAVRQSSATASSSSHRPSRIQHRATIQIGSVDYSGDRDPDIAQSLEGLKEVSESRHGRHGRRQRDRTSNIANKVREDQSTLFKPVALENCDMIIPNLFLGGMAAAMDTNRMVDQGIRAVVCCCRETEFPDKDQDKENIEYHRVDVEDIAREPIELYFPEATQFIHSWLSREQPVLVHCRAGVSRSASVVLAYLVEYLKYSLHDAFFLVRVHRKIITPNLGFIEKLMEYEEEKRGTDPSIDINKYSSWYTSTDQAAVPDLRPE